MFVDKIKIYTKLETAVTVQFRFIGKNMLLPAAQTAEMAAKAAISSFR